MKFKFYTCDVFTNVRFGGNPLAVLPAAAGLSSDYMQKIAREFNFSESTFVFPPSSNGDRAVRIFTPVQEIPFAGHPNIGTAFCLASAGDVDLTSGEAQLVFEEAAGNVAITVRQQDDGIWCELKAPQPLILQEQLSVELIASALSLSTEDLLTELHPPQVASVGLPFVVVALKDQQALARARCNLPVLEEIHAQGVMPDILVYARANDNFDLRVRVFAPLNGVPEDPATGSANCALAALLAHVDDAESNDYRWRIAQGVEMNRPSILDARAHKENGIVDGVWIAGSSVMVSEGFIQV